MASGGAGAAVRTVLLALLVVAVSALGWIRADVAEPSWSPGSEIPPESLPPIVAPVGGDLAGGGMVTRLSNVLQSGDGPVVFDHSLSGDLWSVEDPSVLVVPADGWYMVGADITTLGTRYEGPANDFVAISVLKNWDGESPMLHATVAYESFHAADGTKAHGDSLIQPVLLSEGDRLELWVVGRAGLLIESNPSDGLPSRSFLDDEGPGLLSPRFYLLPV